MLVSKTSNIRVIIHTQFVQCINKGIHSPLPFGTEFKSPKDFYFSSSMCCLAICLELLWIFEIKQAVPIVHNLAWAPLKNCTWSEAFKFIVGAATTSWSILMGGFLELSYGLSFLVVTILASTFQFLSSKSLYQERSQDFPGVRTIFKTYPHFLLSSPVTFPHYVC